MMVVFVNFADSLVRLDDETKRLIDNVNCVVSSYVTSGVHLPYETILESVQKGVTERIAKMPPWDDAFLVEELSYRARIFVVSNFSQKVVKDFLIRNNLDAFVDGVISSGDVMRLKPSREFFEMASKKANVPSQAITLVSSNPFDVLMAKSLRMRAFWLNRRGSTFPFPAGLQPDSIVSNLRVVAEIAAEKKVDSRIGDSALRCT
jgi:FMN phosphatase YigB (HAD superfamily)